MVKLPALKIFSSPAHYIIVTISSLYTTIRLFLTSPLQNRKGNYIDNMKMWKCGNVEMR